MDIFESKICPVTGLDIDVRDEWQLKHGNYSCRIGVIAESIIISEPHGISVKETTDMFLKTFEEIIDTFPNTEKVVLIDNYGNFNMATNEARRDYINYLNSHPKIVMIIYMGLSRKMYLSVNIGKMINVLRFPIKIAKNYDNSISEAIKRLSSFDSRGNVFNQVQNPVLKFDDEPKPHYGENESLSELLKNPAVSLYIDEFNKYLTNIQWNDEKYIIPSVEGVSDNHPLNVLRQGLSLVKSDVGELIKDFIKQAETLKEAQKELQEMNSSLEKLVELKTKKLEESNRKLKLAKEEAEAAREEAELANRGKAVFLASISHELKTPLNSILSYSSMGVSRIEQLSKSKISNYFSRVNSSGKRLLALVESLIDITKFEAGVMQFNYKSKNFIACVQEVISELSYLLNKKKIQVHLKNNLETSYHYFDKTRIIQVLVNIITNAVKFTDENKNIFITVSETDEEVICSIKDEGKGVLETELTVIFETFRQGKNSNYSTGTGLGLAICKNIINAHKGRIWAENYDSGAIFSFTISKDRESFTRK